MTTETGQVTVPTPSTTPPPDPDAGKYAELRKELELETPETDEPAEPAEAATEPAADPARAKPEHVPYAEHENVQKALRAAREAQRAADERLAGIMELVNRSREQRQPEPKKDEPAKIPDVQEDPIGHFQAQLALERAARERLEQQLQATSQDQQTYQQQRAMYDATVASEQDIIKEKPDYWDACAHLESARIAQLQVIYPRATEEQIVGLLNQDRQAVVVAALEAGMTPAQMYYTLAEKAGYQPKAKSNGKEVSLADRAKQQLEATKKGIKASTSLSGDTGGRKGANDMSLVDLERLFVEDPEAADKVWEQMAKAGKLG